MRWYRCISNLSFGERRVPRGTLVQLSGKRADALLAAGAISILHTPPVAAIPGWKLRAERLTPAGIVSCEELLNASAARIAEIMEVHEKTVEKWKRELIDRWLAETPPAG